MPLRATVLSERFAGALDTLWPEGRRDPQARLGLAVSGGPDSLALLLLAALVLVNMLAQRYKFRMDLTGDKRYTLDQATLDLLHGLPETVTVTAYFTGDLPPELSVVRQDFKDLLVEYAERSGGKLVFEFEDPGSSEADSAVGSAQPGSAAAASPRSSAQPSHAAAMPSVPLDASPLKSNSCSLSFIAIILFGRRPPLQVQAVAR